MSHLAVLNSELQVDPVRPIPSLWFVTSRQAGCTLAKVPAETKSTVGQESHLLAIAFVQTLPKASPPPVVPTAHQAWLLIKLLLNRKGRLKCQRLGEAVLLPSPLYKQMSVLHSFGSSRHAGNDWALWFC